MNKYTREKLNDLIRLMVSLEFLVDRAETSEQHEIRVESLNSSIEDFFIEIDKIWYSNNCKDTQNSLNYYCKKAGLPTRRVTAYI